MDRSFGEPELAPAARKQALGRLGERLAARRAESLGYTVVERNYRCPHGEIDLVVRDGPVLVVVEVRTRQSREEAAPELSIGPRKRAKLRVLAEYYQAERFPEVEELRIDVCAVQFAPGGLLCRVKWMENAVTAD